MKTKILAIMLIIIMCFSIPLTMYGATESELKDKKTETESKKNEAEKELEKTKQEKSKTLTEIRDLDSKISDSEDKLDTLKVQVNELEESISQTQKELKEAEESYNANKELMDKRLIALHEAGETSFLDVLLNASDFSDFISKYFTVQELAEHDSQLIESIEKEKQTIQTKKEELDTKKQKVDENKKEQEQTNKELKNNKSDKSSKVAALSEEEKKTQKEIDSYKAAINQVEKQIEQIMKDAEEKVNGGSNGGTGIKFDGSFVWPCVNKTVTSTVKIRWGRWHKGIDIAARYENVYAAASGYAYNASNPGGYGTYVMVIHGSGYITLYGHLQSSKISNGQFVKQGQVIATSGNSGASQGAHLHFEIRKCKSLGSMFTSGNNFLNPLDYLPGGYKIAPGATTPS